MSGPSWRSIYIYQIIKMNIWSFLTNIYVLYQRFWNKCWRFYWSSSSKQLIWLSLNLTLFLSIWFWRSHQISQSWLHLFFFIDIEYDTNKACSKSSSFYWLTWKFIPHQQKQSKEGEKREPWPPWERKQKFRRTTNCFQEAKKLLTHPKNIEDSDNDRLTLP